MCRSPNLAFPDESDKRMKPKADIFTPVSDSTFNQRAHVQAASRSSPYIGGLPAGPGRDGTARAGTLAKLTLGGSGEGLAFVRTARAGAWTGYGERTGVGDAPPFPADRAGAAGVRSYSARCAVSNPTSHS